MPGQLSTRARANAGLARLSRPEGSRGPTTNVAPAARQGPSRALENPGVERSHDAHRCAVAGSGRPRHRRPHTLSARRRGSTAAALCRRMPMVAVYLHEGRISLTKLCHLKDSLAPENCLALLEQAASMTEREVEVLAAQLHPEAARTAPDRICQADEMPNPNATAHSSPPISKHPRSMSSHRPSPRETD